MNTFHQDQFNLTSYNTNQIDYFYLSAALSENVSSAASPAAKYTPAVNMQEKITAAAEGIRCFFVLAEGAETIDKTISAYGYFYLSATGSETLSRTISIAGVYYVAALSSETVTESGSISEIVCLSPQLAESVSKTLSISEQVYLKSLLTEIIDSVVDAESFRYCYCNLDVTIKPGSVLIVDAVNYNVFLDGENIVYAHSGDWLDELNRTTQSLKITGTGSTNLSASILYTERYL